MMCCVRLLWFLKKSKVVREEGSSAAADIMSANRPPISEMTDLVKDFIYTLNIKTSDHIICDLCVITQATISFKNSNLKTIDTLATDDTCTITIGERILCLILSKICVLFRHEHINVIYTIAHLLSPYYQLIHSKNHKGLCHHRHPSAHTWT